MKMEKTLIGIVLAGVLVFDRCSGKVNDTRYDFNGKLEREQVEFSRQENFWFFSGDDDLYLTVTKADGKTITYIDRGNNLKLDEFVVGDEVYRNDAVGQKALESAQQQFEGYLTKILEYKHQKAVDSIK